MTIDSLASQTQGSSLAYRFSMCKNDSNFEVKEEHLSAYFHEIQHGSMSVIRQNKKWQAIKLIDNQVVQLSPLVTLTVTTSVPLVTELIMPPYAHTL